MAASFGEKLPTTNWFNSSTKGLGRQQQPSPSVTHHGQHCELSHVDCRVVETCQDYVQYKGQSVWMIDVKRALHDDWRIGSNNHIHFQASCCTRPPSKLLFTSHQKSRPNTKQSTKNWPCVRAVHDSRQLAEVASIYPRSLSLLLEQH